MAKRRAALLAALPLVLFVGGACDAFRGEQTTDAPSGAPDAGVDAAPDAATCQLPKCSAQQPSCRAYSFDANPCDGVTYSGDSKGVTHDCTGGKLHVAADGTLDDVAHVVVDSPQTFTGIRVGMKLAVNAWDKDGVVVEITTGGRTAAVLTSVSNADGNYQIKLCDRIGSGVVGCENAFVARPKSEHALLFTITTTELRLDVDCVAAVSGQPEKPATNANVEVIFGKTDAQPIDGTIDDLVVQFF
jgi:hypothetical protein